MKPDFTAWLMAQPVDYLNRLHHMWYLDPPLIDTSPQELRKFRQMGEITNDELISLAQHLYGKA